MAMKYKLLFLGAMALLIAACGESSSSSGKANNSSNDDRDTLAEQNRVIFGVAQKGPFLRGGNVTLRELDGETLALTGKSFQGEIFNDSGAFSISGVTLASQYALLEANGNYWNENTARASNGSITLNALVDLSKSVNVNVNLLTHLEYERAFYLTTTGMNVYDAKKQAKKDVFNAFGITGDFANSEDLDILAAGDGNTALLAISILMQGDISEAQLVQRLAEFAEDIEEDGTWDDAEAKTQIADWAYSAVPVLIRTSVKAMLASDSVPDFESIIKNFWWSIYGLGTCSAANSGEIKKNADSLSAVFDVNFICDTGIVNWRRATLFDNDTYQWDAESDGTIKDGNVSGTKYKYDERQGQWLNANELDTALDLNGCTQKREAEVGRGNDSIYYICRSGEWQIATVVEYDTYQWTAGNDGFIRTGRVTGTKYKYDSLQVRWLEVNAADTALGLNACTKKREKEIERGNDSVYYICRKDQWRETTIWEVPKEKRLNPNIPYGTMTDSRDGQTYRTVIIGSQTWMAENLNFDYKVAGASYGNWCYGDTAKYCAVTGRLYTWGAAMDSTSTDCGYFATYYCNAGTVDTGKVQGVCPNGWHLPKTEEWNALFAAVGGKSTAGTALKANSGWSNNGNGLDEFGFSVLPSGMLLGPDTERFILAGEWATFWSTHTSRGGASYMEFRSRSAAVSGNSAATENAGRAVRCVKDDE